MIKFIIVIACLIFVSCSSSQHHTGVPLENTRWVLRILNDKKIFTPEGGKEIYIQFQKKDNRLNGNAGCNNFFGTFTVTDNRLKFGPIARTEMFCELQMATENSFLKALEQTMRYEIKGDYLYFYDATKLLAKFQASYFK